MSLGQFVRHRSGRASIRALTLILLPLAVVHDRDSGAASAPVVITPPSVAKTFSPNLIKPGVSTLVTVTLANPNDTVATLSAPLDDSLPSHMAIGGGVGTTTCANGTVSAITGFALFELAIGAQIPAQGSCAVAVCVIADQANPYTNTKLTSFPCGRGFSSWSRV